MDHKSSPFLDSKELAELPVNQQQNVQPRKRRSLWILFLATFLLASFKLGSVICPHASLHLNHYLYNFTFEEESEPDYSSILLNSISNDSIAKWSYHYTREPHLAGTNYELVEWTADKFEDAGFETEIVTYETLLNYPVDSALKLISPKKGVVFEASLEEDVIEEDPTTGIKNRVPTFHGYSKSGNVTANFIYGHYCTIENFETLEEKKVQIEGNIVICRYGANFRGTKVELAQERGAVGVVIYSDPGDDGGITVDNGYKAYPDGPARNPSSVQRGSVQFLNECPGDPTTPGWPSIPGAERIEPTTIPSIPSLPVSVKDITPILKHLSGLGPKIDWEGEIKSFDYSPGPSEFQLNLYNLQDYGIRPIWNVIGKLEGHISNEIVVIGNHRDAWIAGGASDPNSGSAVLIELARSFAEITKLGYKPLRTIVLASWDGEEYGLLGSTEYGEDKAKFLRKNVVAYLNLDDAVSGNEGFAASASPLLYDLLVKTSKDIPYGKGTLYDLWHKTNKALVRDLGSGSDFTVFQHHLGIPSLDFGFGGKSVVYQYHSNYDSYHWMEKFGDPGFKAHKAAAQFLSKLAFDLVQTPVARLVATDYPKRINYALDNLEKLASSDNSFRAQTLELFEGVRNATAQFAQSAEVFDANANLLAIQFEQDLPWYEKWKKFIILAKIRASNAKVFAIEGIFLHKKGLEGRKWFKSIMFAPNRFNGYSAVALPGLREAVEDNDFEGLIKWVEIYKGKIQAAAGLLTY